MKRNALTQQSVYGAFDIEGVFSGRTKNEFSFDVDENLEKARKGEKLSEAAINLICTKVKEIFMKEDNVC